MKRILVTGAGGQLGRSIADIACEYSSTEFLFTNKTELDITNQDEVLKAFREFKPHYCINCAAYTKVDQAERTPKPAYAVNVQGVEHLVRACDEMKTTS